MDFQRQKSSLYVLLPIFLNQFLQVHAPVFLKEGESVKIMRDQDLAKKLFQSHVGEWSTDVAAVSILFPKSTFYFSNKKAIIMYG